MRWIKIFLYLGILYATLPRQQLYFSSAEARDSRPDTLRQFLEAKNSPLAGSSAIFIKKADEYKLDWRLLPSIAGVESGFERAGNVTDFNPFGYMCSSGPCKFASYEESIERVAKTISRGRAYSKFQQTNSILELAKVYNYVSPSEWTTKVQFFIDKL